MTFKRVRCFRLATELKERYALPLQNKPTAEQMKGDITMKKEFQAVFQLSKVEVFEVRYYHFSTNKQADFATSAARFCRNKRDFSTCGQAQESVCKNHKCAYNFYKKWDVKHLHDLTEAEYKEMRLNLEKLMERYNFIIEELDESKRPYSPRFSFWRLAEWTKQKPKAIRV